MKAFTMPRLVAANLAAFFRASSRRDDSGAYHR